MKKHVGNLLEDAVRASEWSITALAQKLNLSRKTIYNYFENPDLEDYIVKRFEHVLHVYIVSESESAGFINERAETYVSKGHESSSQFWKDKYLDLLEKYSALLEQHNE